MLCLLNAKAAEATLEAPGKPLEKQRILTKALLQQDVGQARQAQKEGKMSARPCVSRLGHVRSLTRANDGQSALGHGSLNVDVSNGIYKASVC